MRIKWHRLPLTGKLENKHFKLMGLPFYNEKLKQNFEAVFENKFLG